MITGKKKMEIKFPKKDLSINKVTEVSKSPKIIVMFDGSQYFAFGGICPHAKWPLDMGKISDHTLICGGHAWEFDITNGKCTSNPGRDLKQYKIIEEENNLIITKFD